MRNAGFALLSVLIGLSVPVIGAEAVLRFLPVSDGLLAEPVNARNPVFHHVPNRTITWSRDWNFSIVNRVRVNNVGYINDQDYDAADPRPLFAVVGDSYVEAAMVPSEESLHRRVARLVGPGARVYSIAVGGAPASQYVIYAQEARNRWKAEARAIVIVGNDFDESLPDYAIAAPMGVHRYVEDRDGSLVLRRFDYQPGWMRSVVERSALAKYLVFNLHVTTYLKALFAFPSLARARADEIYVGNTRAAADRERLERSKRVVATFLNDLVSKAGWLPHQVVFLVDGIRYPNDDPAVSNSFFVRIREYFMAEARRAGFETIDLDRWFFAELSKRDVRFEFPTDGHWNGVAHGVAAEALSASVVFSQWRQRAGRIADADRR